MSPSECSLPECSSPSYSRGWCAPHYERWRIHGDPRSGRGCAPGVPLAYRIAVKTDFSGDLNGCWTWLGNQNPHGYGKLCVNGKYQLVARLVYELHHGPIAGGLYVLHHCDNPPCINPAHLYAGTAKDNAQDRERRGRGNQAKGEQAATAKLTVADVLEIRERFAHNGISRRKLGDEYGVAESTINAIVQGQSWKHVKSR